MNILIAGGGTGGHLFPAIAVAEEINSSYPNAKVTFVGTAAGLEARVIPLTMWELVTIDAPRLKGMGMLRKLSTFAMMPLVLLKAMKIVKRARPDIVISVGGYAAGPVTLVAALKGIPTVAMEQNAVPGLTNRILGRFVKKIFVMFPESCGFFPAKKTVIAGNPVRKKIRDVLEHRSAKKRGFTVLVFGGSQGAKAINERMLSALQYLSEAKEDLHIIHQVGRAADTERISAAYRAQGFSAEVYHFIEDMGKVYAQADMVVARAGATTCAELTVAGLPAMFIPYPYAADNHQEANARALVKQGGAIMIRESELTSELLAREIIGLMEEPLKLVSMSQAMRAYGRPEAAERIVRESLMLVERS